MLRGTSAALKLHQPSVCNAELHWTGTSPEDLPGFWHPEHSQRAAQFLRRYLQHLLRTARLDGLLAKHTEMLSEIKTLDSDMQMLVYENYNRFISATDTVRTMKSNVDGMDTSMQDLEKVTGFRRLSKPSMVMSPASRSEGLLWQLQRIHRLHLNHPGSACLVRRRVHGMLWSHVAVSRSSMSWTCRPSPVMMNQPCQRTTHPQRRARQRHSWSCDRILKSNMLTTQLVRARAGSITMHDVFMLLCVQRALRRGAKR